MASKESKPAPLVVQLFGVDLRSLALFRVALGAVSVADVLTRATDLSAHYTDAGILPRSDLLRAFPWLHEWPLCVHLVTGSAVGEAVLFTLHAGFALALLVGYRTRLATVVVWLLTASLQLRNLYVGHASDAQLRMMLFWACFLPLGARYSVDSARRWSTPPREPQQFLSVGTVALIAQLVVMYLSSGYAKSQYPWWRQGTAVGFVFDNEIWGTYTGHFLLQFPALSALLTYVTLFLELVGPALLLAPVCFGPIRTVTVGALIAMHLGFALGLRVGIFPFASITHLLCLLPAWFWERLLARLRTPERCGAAVAFHDACHRCSTVLLLFRTFFLLPETTLDGLPQRGGNAAADALWRVIDPEGRRHVNADAFRYLCHLSPLLWPVAPLLWWQPLRALSNVAWDRFAHHVVVGPSQLAVLVPRPHVRRQRGVEVLCGICLAYVIFWNVGVLGDRDYTAPPAIAWLGNSLFFQQDWRMFGRVATRTGWVVIPGTLKDGTLVDLFRLGGPVPRLGLYRDGTRVDFARPDSVIYRVKNYRWLKMMDQLIYLKRGEQQLLLYGRYLCRQWNARHADGQQLQSLEIIFMARDVVPETRRHRTEEYDKEILWRHWCFGAPPENLS